MYHTFKITVKLFQNYHTIIKAYSNACSMGLSTTESAAFNRLSSHINQFEKKHGNETITVNIYGAPEPRHSDYCRLAPAYPGEKPLSIGETWTLRRYSDQISVKGPLRTFLFLLAHRLRPQNCVEIGMAYGISGMSILTGLSLNSSGHLTGIELLEYYAPYVAENFLHFPPDRWEVKYGNGLRLNSSPTLQGRVPYDLGFIDGAPRKEERLTCFRSLVPLMNTGGVVVFDEIHWTRYMDEAWHEIKKHPRVVRTEDFGRFGVALLK